jgi:hypothetical protein
VVFGHHVHLILILSIFSSGVVWRTKFTTVTIFKVCILLRVYYHVQIFYRQRNKFLLLFRALHVSISVGHLQVLQVLRIQLPNCNVHINICIHIVHKRLQTRLWFTKIMCN